MLRLLVVVAVLAGCGLHRSYNPAPLESEREVDARAIRTVGDVQLAFALRFVGASDGAPLMTVWLRNAGVESVAVDFERLRVRGSTDAGTRALQLHDPRGEIEPLHIDPGARGREKIRLADPGAKAGTLRKVCLDVGPMFTDRAVELAPICFAPGADASWEVAP